MDHHVGPIFLTACRDPWTTKLVRIFNLDIRIYGPSNRSVFEFEWPEFFKRDAEIHGPPNWSELKKKGTGIHGPQFWFEFLKKGTGINHPPLEVLIESAVR